MGGGGVKAGPLTLVFKFYFNDFTILLNYVVGWKSRPFLTSLFVAIFGKNMALLVQKFVCQNPFTTILRLKKVLMATKLEGGIRPK